MNLEKYKTIILDLDGVVLDSNTIKEDNIFEAVKTVFDAEIAQKFTAYFTSLNGVPRETKIFGYFEDKEKAQNILESYNQKNQASLLNVAFTEGFLDFFETIKNLPIKKYILSGGDEKEIKAILHHKKIDVYFDAILGGPNKKDENLKTVSFDYPVIYFGDSQIDYETAQKFNFDFVFMFQYTQMKDWRNYFSGKQILLTIKNFTEIQL
jgi:phosphoglycolate phosphatase-like HAD superfamily hydrolase